MILVSHVLKDLMEKFIHKIRQMSQIYIMFFTVKLTTHVFYNKQYSQGAIDLKTIKLYIIRVLTSLYC